MALYAKLAGILADRRKQILDIWLERTLQTYKSPNFFIQVRDPFTNPVGMLIRDGLSRIFELLCQEAEEATYIRPVDQIVRIRAVQEFAASQAVVPFLELRWVVREVLADNPSFNLPADQLQHFDCAAERVALIAFDLYCRCREQLYRTRVRELKSGRARFTDGGCPSRLLDADTKSGASEKE